MRVKSNRISDVVHNQYTIRKIVRFNIPIVLIVLSLLIFFI